MYYYDSIKDVVEVKRTDGGAVQCAANHNTGYSYRTTPRPAATQVFAEYTGGGTCRALYAVCNKHAGVIKSQVTKGSYSFRGVERVDVTVEAMALNPAGLITTLSTARQRNVAIQVANAQAEELGRKRQGWDAARNDYHFSEVLPLNQKPERTLPKEDDFGRVYIRVTFARLTPKQARTLASELTALASEAELETSVQEKP
jgi:hypothetical protein